MTTTREHRKAIPVGVKLQAALLALGFTQDEVSSGIEWDHFPALALRLVDPETGELVPAPNDPRYIRPLRKAAHATKTFGTKATTAGSDIHAAAKSKRLVKSEAEFRSRLLTKQPGEARPKRSRIPSRPFQRKARRSSASLERGE